MVVWLFNRFITQTFCTMIRFLRRTRMYSFARWWNMWRDISVTKIPSYLEHDGTLHTVWEKTCKRNKRERLIENCRCIQLTIVLLEAHARLIFKERDQVTLWQARKTGSGISLSGICVYVRSPMTIDDSRLSGMLNDLYLVGDTWCRRTNFKQNYGNQNKQRRELSGLRFD